MRMLLAACTDQQSSARLGCPLLGGSGCRIWGSSGQMTRRGSLRREGPLGAALPADQAPLLASSSTGSSAFPPPGPDGPVLVTRLSPLVCTDLSLDGFTQAQVFRSC